MTDTEHLDVDSTELVDTRSRVRSKIAFPYTPLADGEQVATALLRRGGTAPIDELAAELGQVTTSGAFRTKLATARTFGVISVRRGQALLTPLGRAIVDPAKASKARADAFLTVPLYRAIYEEHRGHTLPNSDGIENVMKRLGVSPKQTERARQAFQRSAEQAGFFGNGPDRLVAPAAVAGPADDKKDDLAKKRPPGSGALPPEVEELMAKLLNDGAQWPAEQTHEYVAAARTIYEMLS